MTRKADQTAALAIGIPDEGAIIVVHSTARANHVSDEILEQRGVDVLRKCKIRVCKKRGALVGLHGLKLPVLIDHAFDSHVAVDVVQDVKIFAAQANMVSGVPFPLSGSIMSEPLADPIWSASADLTQSRT